MNRPAVGLLLAALLLAGGTAAREVAPATDTTPPQLRVVPVVGAARVCPDLIGGVPGLVTRVSVATPPLPPALAAAAGAATVEVTAVAPGASGVPLPLDRPGVALPAIPLQAAGTSAVVEAGGSAAPEFTAVEVLRSDEGAERGLALARCAPPQRDAWLLGAATTVGATALLELVNVDDRPATVDVSLLSPDGPREPKAGRNLAVRPHQRTVLPLDRLLPDQPALAVHIVASTGRVAPAIRQAVGGADAPGGREFVPAAGPPASTVLVPGVPPGPGPRVLRLANPGQTDAVVSVQLTTPTAQFVPAGLDAVQIGAGTVAQVDLTAVLASTAATVRVRSDGAPVLAAVMAEDGREGTPGRDLALVGAAAPLSAPAVAAGGVQDGPSRADLSLTAPDGPATATLQPLPAAWGPAAPALPPAVRVDVPAGRMVVVPASSLPGAAPAVTVVVTPLTGSGPLFAASYLREEGARGPLITSLPLVPEPQTATLPEVRRDPGAAWPEAGPAVADRG